MTVRSREEVVRELVDEYGIGMDRAGYVWGLLQRAYDAGRLAEREAVVGWLRGHDGTAAEGLRDLADEFQRGVHLQPTPGKGEP